MIIRCFVNVPLLMNKNNLVLWGLLAAVFLAACNNSDISKPTEKPTVQAKFKADSFNKVTQFNTDSIELTKLVRNLYEWHETTHIATGFPFKGNTPSDTIFTGVDWDVYNREVEVMKKTNFFSQKFLDRHRAIAATIDSSIKKASIEWRNFNDGIPLWNTDADDWCGCQDNPDNYWTRLKISHLELNGNTAVFSWAWGIEDGIDPPFKYNMKAKKENGIWKIAYMEGFNSYGSVADYDKRMNR